MYVSVWIVYMPECILWMCMYTDIWCTCVCKCMQFVLFVFLSSCVWRFVCACLSQPLMASRVSSFHNHLPVGRCSRFAGIWNLQLTIKELQEYRTDLSGYRGRASEWETKSDRRIERSEKEKACKKENGRKTLQRLWFSSIFWYWFFLESKYRYINK